MNKEKKLTDSANTNSKKPSLDDSDLDDVLQSIPLGDELEIDDLVDDSNEIISDEDISNISLDSPNDNANDKLKQNIFDKNVKKDIIDEIDIENEDSIALLDLGNSEKKNNRELNLTDNTINKQNFQTRNSSIININLDYDEEKLCKDLSLVNIDEEKSSFLSKTIHTKINYNDSSINEFDDVNIKTISKRKIENLETNDVDITREDDFFFLQDSLNVNISFIEKKNDNLIKTKVYNDTSIEDTVILENEYQADILKKKDETKIENINSKYYTFSDNLSDYEINRTTIEISDDNKTLVTVKNDDDIEEKIEILQFDSEYILDKSKDIINDNTSSSIPLQVEVIVPKEEAIEKKSIKEKSVEESDSIESLQVEVIVPKEETIEKKSIKEKSVEESDSIESLQVEVIVPNEKAIEEEIIEEKSVEESKSIEEKDSNNILTENVSIIDDNQISSSIKSEEIVKNNDNSLNDNTLSEKIEVIIPNEEEIFEEKILIISDNIEINDSIYIVYNDDIYDEKIEIKVEQKDKYEKQNDFSEEPLIINSKIIEECLEDAEKNISDSKEYIIDLNKSEVMNLKKLIRDDEVLFKKYKVIESQPVSKPEIKDETIEVSEEKINDVTIINAGEIEDQSDIQSVDDNNELEDEDFSLLEIPKSYSPSELNKIVQDTETTENKSSENKNEENKKEDIKKQAIDNMDIKEEITIQQHEIMTTSEEEIAEETSTSEEEIAEETSTSEEEIAEETSTSEEEIAEETSTSEEEIAEETSTSEEEIAEETSTSEEETQIEIIDNLEDEKDNVEIDEKDEDMDKIEVLDKKEDTTKDISESSEKIELQDEETDNMDTENDDLVIQEENLEDIQTVEDFLHEDDEIILLDDQKDDNLEINVDDITDDETEEASTQDIQIEELKDILQYIDTLFADLPEEKIKEFAKSKYYDMYNNLFDELGL